MLLQNEILIAYKNILRKLMFSEQDSVTIAYKRSREASNVKQLLLNEMFTIF